MKTDLQGKIEGLAEKDLITKDNCDILHNLRFIGNDALHELTAPPKSELKLAINIVEHAIESLYEIKHKALRLRRNLDQRKKPKTK